MNYREEGFCSGSRETQREGSRAITSDRPGLCWCQLPGGGLYLVFLCGFISWKNLTFHWHIGSCHQLCLPSPHRPGLSISYAPTSAPLHLLFRAWDALPSSSLIEILSFFKVSPGGAHSGRPLVAAGGPHTESCGGRCPSLAGVHDLRVRSPS